jgi:hypothetical protein
MKSDKLLKRRQTQYTARQDQDGGHAREDGDDAVDEGDADEDDDNAVDEGDADEDDDGDIDSIEPNRSQEPYFMEDDDDDTPAIRTKRKRSE